MTCIYLYAATHAMVSQSRPSRVKSMTINVLENNSDDKNISLYFEKDSIYLYFVLNTN